ncbi:MAG: Nuclear control of ATPase protein 2 [Vezdaea aestivalis]|nr:MAG: Nuclear control of ATPase protein 2 [Vezdaea aestivalis]
MSFVADQIKRADSQLDRFHLAFVSAKRRNPSDGSESEDFESQQLLKAPRIEAAVRTLSVANSSRTLLPRSTILALLNSVQSEFNNASEHELLESHAKAEQLQWLLVGKATNQVFGTVLHILLDQILPLHSDLWYWDSVLGSYQYTSLYSIQTSPLRIQNWAYDIFAEVKRRLDSTGLARTLRLPGSQPPNEAADDSPSLRHQWVSFYRLVRGSIEQRSLLQVKSAVVSPLAQIENEIREKRKGVRKLMEMSASGLGLLMDECLSFAAHHENGSTENGSEHSTVSPTKKEWKAVVEESVALIESVLIKITAEDISVPEFDEVVFSSVEVDSAQAIEPEEAGSLDTRSVLLAQRLRRILVHHIPAHIRASSDMSRKYGRPSRLIRYWLPATALLFASSTIFRIMVNRQAELIVWVRESGDTAIDFWKNWVVEPTKKVIGTIRHDKDSQVALMSKQSLEGDRASLERMVVDFAIDNPSVMGAKSLSESAIADVRAKVQEGDLTPVLKAYEKDLRKPFMGTVRGDLVRALLIQIQKTKVDVEIAMGGIDALLKSQELVFGFVGLTPGILVTVAATRYLGSLFSSRKGFRLTREQSLMVRSLRNVDRILSAAAPANKMLSYRDHGLLLCEVHVLRERASVVLPKDVLRDFIEDLEDLVDIRTGVERQAKVVDRIVWAYRRWLR